jgi:putative lipoprotein
METLKILSSSAALMTVVALSACQPATTLAVAASCPVVTGEIWYKPKIALPNDATILVRLEEQGIADVAAAVIGETKILSDGQQVPIAFSLQPDCTILKKAAMPGFTVRIEDSKGALMFINDTHFPLSPNGGANRIEVIKVQ